MINRKELLQMRYNELLKEFDEDNIVIITKSGYVTKDGLIHSFEYKEDSNE